MNFARLSALYLIGTCVQAQAAHPNIIVMMADDMGMGDTSAYQDVTGNSDEVQLHTPHMERLAHWGVRFTDAHTPTSRCSGTRYGLLTGRYPWRSRLKHWVLFGAQGDPMIEADRPTIATMLRDSGYRTAIVGKWHVGLRFRQSSGEPAAGWKDADLSQPLHTCPVDHGFDFSRITSRSHGTSGPDAGNPQNKKNQSPNKRGPGHIHRRRAIGAKSSGRELVKSGAEAYVLKELGGRHSDSVMELLSAHVTDQETRGKPFFLYYPANANHGPYTPDDEIAGVPVAGAARTKSGVPTDARHDFIYENDVALGRIMDWLEQEDDPRLPEKKLRDNTILIFTSDNGAEKNSDIATGPFRSHKGSAYEGGHRVPFLVAWPAGGVGDGNHETPGLSNSSVIALQDLYATFAEIVDAPLPDLRKGEKGAEDSQSVLDAFRGKTINRKLPLFHNDHSQSKDRAACAIRLDMDSSDDGMLPGKWKLLMDASLIRHGIARELELYDLAADSKERKNLVASPAHAKIVNHLKQVAVHYRNLGAVRSVDFEVKDPIVFDLRQDFTSRHGNDGFQSVQSDLNLTINIFGGSSFSLSPRGLGVPGSESDLVNHGEGVKIRFDHDVLVESVAITCEQGSCGGYYQVGTRAPLAIYCVDGDNDAQDQSGVLSDLGVLRANEDLTLHTERHMGVEPIGAWRLQWIRVRPLD